MLLVVSLKGGISVLLVMLGTDVDVVRLMVTRIGNLLCQVGGCQVREGRIK